MKEAIRFVKFSGKRARKPLTWRKNACTGYLAHPFERKAHLAAFASLFLAVSGIGAIDPGGELFSFRRENTGVWTVNYQERHAMAP
jgi:hypothetical protein